MSVIYNGSSPVTLDNIDNVLFIAFPILAFYLYKMHSRAFIFNQGQQTKEHLYYN